ncbi:MAG: L,D-transpeptidase family protein [Pseudomonadota bacterium]
MRVFGQPNDLSRRGFLASALGAVAAGCTAPVPEVEVAAVDPRSTFQRLLDAQGVPYQAPKAGKAILVNIPGFEVLALQDGEPVLRSRAIVGTRRDQTPVMGTRTSVVRFRPTWRPTPTMVRRGEYPDRVWPAGADNPLGLAALRLEPGMLIYLHSTNRPQLFDREARALSHGCVRVEAWDALMAWAAGIDLETFHRNTRSAGTFDVPTDGSIPVTFGYFLNFPDAAGAPRSHADIYGRGESSRFGAPVHATPAGTVPQPA